MKSKAAWAQGSIAAKHRGIISPMRSGHPEIFQNSAHDNYDEAQLDAMAAMKATIKHADIMNMLAVADDRLHSKPFGEA